MLGVAALLIVLASLGSPAVALGAATCPLGAVPARLAEAVIGFALLIVVLEILGAVGSSASARSSARRPIGLGTTRALAKRCR